MMNNLTIQFSQISVIINVAIRIVTSLIFIGFLIPLFLKEAKVKNGLRLLRYELLFTGSIIFFINTAGILIILFGFFGLDTQKISTYVTYINTFGFLAYALVKLKIYTQKYSEKSLKMHAKMERFESREIAKDEKKDKKIKEKQKVKSAIIKP